MPTSVPLACLTIEEIAQSKASYSNTQVTVYTMSSMILKLNLFFFSATLSQPAPTLTYKSPFTSQQRQLGQTTKMRQPSVDLDDDHNLDVFVSTSLTHAINLDMSQMICHNNIKPNMELGDMVSILILNQILISLQQHNGVIYLTGIHELLKAKMVALGGTLTLIRNQCILE